MFHNSDSLPGMLTIQQVATLCQVLCKVSAFHSFRRNSHNNLTGLLLCFKRKAQVQSHRGNCQRPSSYWNKCRLAFEAPLNALLPSIEVTYCCGEEKLRLSMGPGAAARPPPREPPHLPPHTSAPSPERQAPPALPSAGVTTRGFSFRSYWAAVRAVAAPPPGTERACLEQLFCERVLIM